MQTAAIIRQRARPDDCGRMTASPEIVAAAASGPAGLRCRS
jgi:hypothetical protein